MIEYGKNTIGKNARIFEPVTIGFPSRENIDQTDYAGTTLGNNAILRSGTILYCDVVAGNNFQTGHNVIIRENTRIGHRVAIGTSTVIEGNTVIGDDVSLQSMVYIPTGTIIESHVFIGPNTVLTNDRYPPTRIGGLQSPHVMEGAAIGANATLLPGVRIGKGALVAAGAIVTRDVPEYKLAIGAPAKIRDLPDQISKGTQEKK
jgi:acetyltransferase-like isoleucine patch superfamily enzyme